MQLLIAVVNRRDYRRLREVLIEHDFRFTEIGSIGGFLGEGSVTLLIGLASDQVETVLGLIAQHCQAREQVVSVAPPDTRAYPVEQAVAVSVGGAHVFVLNVDRVMTV